jgi:serine/threonine protein phosphatase PrpC
MTIKTIDTAWALSKGQRSVQEDVLHYWFDKTARSGYIIIADGMGGHTSGDIASSLAVEAVDEYLAQLWVNKDDLAYNITKYLPKLLACANDRIASYIKSNLQTKGMGTTLLIVIILDGHLYWASVGDSPLYLMRGRHIKQINEDHSMARQIDQMVHAGQLTKKAANEHPNRNALTSVVMGDVISDMDCSKVPIELEIGDIWIAATDGLCSMPLKTLERNLLASDQSADDIVASITEAIDALNIPTQDNLAICVAKVL